MSKILLFFILAILIFITGLILSKIKIDIVLNQLFDEKSKKNIFDFKIIISIWFFYKIKLINFVINKENVEKFKIIGKYPKTPIKMDRKILKVIKRFKFSIEQLKIKIKFDTQDLMITNFITVILSTIISSILLKYSKNLNKNLYNFYIKPLYEDQNYLDLQLQCIINVKVANAIKVLYRIIKEERQNNKANKIFI